MATTAPVTSSTIGLKDLIIAPLEEDTVSALSYGTLQAVAGAIEATVSPNNADPDIQYADDAEYDAVYTDPEVSLTTQLADLPLAIQELILGSEIDDNGVLVRAAGNKPQYFAVGFRSLKANGKYRCVWLYKCRAKPISETYGTKQGSTINRQTASVEWTAVKRIFDGMTQCVADEGVGNFTTAMIATFFANVYTPFFTAAKLSALTISGVTLSPTFAVTTTTYTGTATASTATITATAATSGAAVEIYCNGAAVTSGSAATLKTGANVIFVKVTSDSAFVAYKVTVTKS